MITVRGAAAAAAHRVARGSAGQHDTSRVNNRPRGTGGGNGTHRAAGRAGVVDVGLQISIPENVWTDDRI